MSWLDKLEATYERCAGVPQFKDSPLLPVAHTTQQAQIEIVLDDRSDFRRASVVPRDDCTTIVPCTEESGGRSGTRPVNHPLCDKLQYIAGDFADFGGEVTSGFAKDPKEPYRAFAAALTSWANSAYAHPKLNAILGYIQKGRTTADLLESGVLRSDARGRLLKEWAGDKKSAPEIFQRIANQGDSFVRWKVELSGIPGSSTWEDQALIESWISYYASLQTSQGVCFVTGANTTLAEQHPAKLRNAGDKAKLISSNDSAGYTFRGRFLDADQVCGVGFQTSQKAHNALRWLIGRQGYRNDKQVVVAWAVAGKPVPDPFQNSQSLFLASDELQASKSTNSRDDQPVVGDAGQAFAKRLRKAIGGYRTALDPTDDIVVMALDSATPGRMAITFYRELKGSEFLDRVLRWHQSSAWYQDYGKDPSTKRPLRFVGAPSPSEIAESAFGPRLDIKLRKVTIERLLPCIVDGRALPRDLVTSAVRRTVNRAGLDRWQWEKGLGVACALFRSASKEGEYKMTLEAERTSRDYLYGRLLALAEHIEGRALYVAGENRDTTAARLMQRFADRPASTWPSIERALSPYKTRLRSKRPAFLHKMDKLLDDIVASFSRTDFLDDRRLSGEFLLGYHCQRRALNAPKPDDPSADEESTQN